MIFFIIFLPTILAYSHGHGLGSADGPNNLDGIKQTLNNNFNLLKEENKENFKNVFANNPQFQNMTKDEQKELKNGFFHDFKGFRLKYNKSNEDFME